MGIICGFRMISSVQLGMADAGLDWGVFWKRVPGACGGGRWFQARAPV